MTLETPREKDPKKVAAGKLGRWARGPLSQAGRAKLRAAAYRNRPWEHSTGPTTPEGKRKAAANGKVRQTGSRSTRELRADVAELEGLLKSLREVQALAAGE